mmetsp:Transcript_18579/g.74658  ORF Transcript_18579/g.74658 Transcript_18579/m.74658 type:complete len:154 (-) Transcript_18579:2632-3093(-)
MFHPGSAWFLVCEQKTAMLKSNTPWKVVAFFFMGLSFLLAMRLSYTLGQESGYIKTSVPGVPGVPHVPGAPGSNVAADPPIPLTPATIPNPLDELRQFAIKPAQVDVEQIKSLPAARRIIGENHQDTVIFVHGPYVVFPSRNVQEGKGACGLS